MATAQTPLPDQYSYRANPRGIDVRTITLKTLTPIWTGNAKGEMTRVEETGILGSLRWWYEALVRTYGGWACDPTVDGKRCEFNESTYDEAERHIGPEITGRLRERLRLRMAGLCDACQLFGATGWQRRFRIEIEGPVPKTPLKLKKVEIDRPGHGQAGRGAPVWNVPSGVSTDGIGPISLRVIGTQEETEEIARTLIQFIDDAAIGARTQIGAGVVTAVSIDPLIKDEFPRAMKDIAELKLDGARTGYGSASLPRLQRMFAIRVELGSLREDDPIKEMLHVKVDVRNLFRQSGETPEDVDRRHRILGTVQGNSRQGSMINVSRAYETSGGASTIRIWGWAPRDDFKLVTMKLGAYLDHPEIAVANEPRVRPLNLKRVVKAANIPLDGE